MTNDIGAAALGALEQTLEPALAKMGFFTAPPEGDLPEAVSFSRIGANGSWNLQLTFEAHPEGAAVRLFIQSFCGDWVPQDLSRWGLPGVLRYSGARGFRRQTQALVRALEPVLIQVDGVITG